MKKLYNEFSDVFVNSFIAGCCRFETSENPRVYCKAVRATLIEVGFDEDFINGIFRDKLEKYVSENFGEIK